MLKRIAVAIGLLWGWNAFAADTVLVTGPSFQQVPAGQIRVKPTGGTEQTLAAALAAASSGLVIGTSTITGTCTDGFVLYNNAGVVGCQAGGGSGLTIGTSTITSGTTTRVLFDNAGVLGEYTISGTGNVAMTTSPTFVTPVLGTVAAGSVLTNATGLPISTGVSGLGANVATALGIAVGSAGAPVVLNGAGGTPSSLTGTNITGTASGLTAGIATVANGLKSATTTVVVSAATAPTAGQVLTAINSTSADWETLSASATSITPGTTTIVGATSPCAIVNTATTVMGCLAYGATGNTTIVQTTSGGLLTASILPVATTSALGGIKPDGQTLVTAAGGVTSTAASIRTAATPTVATTDMGGTIFVSSGTITIPAITTNLFDAKQTLLLVNYSGSTEAISTTPTINAGGNCVSGTGIPAGYAWALQSNNTTLDCVQLVSAAAAGAVTSVSNSDGTLTISPTTGAVVASIALGHANTWSGQQTFVAPILGTPASGVGTNLTGIPIATGVSGLGTGVATAAAIATNAAGGVGTIGTSGATVGLLNGTNTFSGTQTFGAVVGGVNIQTGTTYTLAATDCGRTVHVSNGSAITVTTFQAAVVGCVINVVQGGAGQITFANGGSATLVSAHSYTKTFAAAGATVSLAVYVNAGSAAVFTLTGDGA